MSARGLCLMKPRNDMLGYKRFGGTFCLHLQDSKVVRNVSILHHYMVL